MTRHPCLSLRKAFPYSRGWVSTPGSLDDGLSLTVFSLGSQSRCMVAISSISFKAVKETIQNPIFDPFCPLVELHTSTWISSHPLNPLMIKLGGVGSHILIYVSWFWMWCIWPTSNQRFEVEIHCNIDTLSLVKWPDVPKMILYGSGDRRG